LEDITSEGSEGGKQGKTYTAADKYTANDLRPRRNAGLGCPSEPEEADDEDDATHHHGRESLFGYDLLGFVELGCEDDFRLPCQGDASNEYADEDGDERQRTNTGAHPTISFKAERIRKEDQVENSVHQADVNGHDDQDGLSGHHLRRLQTVFLHQVTELDGILVELGVQGPVACLLTQASGLLLEDDGWEGFLECE
jgi:hypothetical protein